MGRDHNETSESVSSIGDCSSDSAGSSSLSSELVEDASSSLSFGCSSLSSTSLGCLSSSSPPDNGDLGPIFELSKLMDNLPIKRGLSKFYDGKSQSYTSLSSVMSLDDLAKAERPCQKRLKLSRSFLEDLADDQQINSRLSIPKCVISVNTSGSQAFVSRFSNRPKKGQRCRPMSSLSLHAQS